ncbi:MAG: anaerobic glycerol-3-phosphate dehydrogenase subunit GlpC [Bacteroidales bacterium]|nr:anaerobic glycerol-3-phosphate dehydrogenase subunit GlpC [Bacteroidales bacterium]MDY3913080.1 anaerobic glycerol-3-phosphate dehydrogenase subunit GlpC [Sodaliphilus sp.]
MANETQLSSISANNFEQCLKCSICTVYCPVAAVNPKYPGPKQSGPDGARYRLKNPAFFDEALKMCLNCKRCEVACPNDVRIGDIIQKARIDYSTHKPSLRDTMLANTDFVGTMANIVAPVTNFALGLPITKSVLHSVMGIDKHRSFPKYSSQKFETWFKRNALKKQDSYKKHVSYFHGCYVNYNFPKLGQDLVKIMNAVGYGVHLLEKEKCCGVALMSNGLIGQAKRQAQLNTDSIRKSVADDKRPVLTTSSTCTFTMRDEYPHLLGVDNADVRDGLTLGTRFLYHLIDEGKIKLAFRPDFKLRVAYHTACHMQKMGWAIYSTELLKMIPGVEFTMLESQCCGIAGTYGFKRENYETSQAIGSGLFENIKRVNPDVVATDCETCKWQIEMSTGYQVMNPISIIADALDVEKTIELNK